MNTESFITLINNTAMLIALVFLYDIIAEKFRMRAWIVRISMGVILGGICIIIMLNPWRFLPGIIFDTRSILLSISGLYIGIAPTAIAAVISLLFRFHQGGAGAWPGAGVILTSAGIGMMWRYFRRPQLSQLSAGELYQMGLLVHLIMVLWMLILPFPTNLNVIRGITLPVMLLYPLGTMLLGKLMIQQLVRKDNIQLLEVNEKRFRNYIDNAPYGIFVANPDGRYSNINTAASIITGYSRQELLQTNLDDLIYESDRESARAHFKETITTGKAVGEFRYVRKDGAIRYWSVHAVRLTENEMIGFVIDVTERRTFENALKTALRDKEVLIRELYHRTKNNMQVIRSMLGLQASYSTNSEVKRICDEVGLKIEAMALVHKKLYQSQDLSHIQMADYITDLVQLLEQTFGINRREIQIEIEAKPIAITIDKAIPCGIVINELITNAYKHAFTGRDSGRIIVCFSQLDENILELKITDNGVGVPTDFDFRSIQSLGIQTVFALIEHQLNGAVTFENIPGISCICRFENKP